MIIPATESNIGRMLVSIHTISTSYKYPAVIKRHINDEVMRYFLDKKIYTPIEITQGFKRELNFIDNHLDGMEYRINNGVYPMAIRLAEDLMVERFDILDFPELYI